MIAVKSYFENITLSNPKLISQIFNNPGRKLTNTKVGIIYHIKGCSHKDEIA